MRAITSIHSFIFNFTQGWKRAGDHILCRCYVREDKARRDSLSEKDIDKMLADTFPASDPVTMY